MSVSKHVISATAHVPAGIVLDRPAGSITLDVSRAPFVQGTIQVKNKPGLFDALDPRAHAGFVSIICGDEIAGTTRQFSLNIRSVRGGDDNTLEIDLASDEARLEDYSPAFDIDLLVEIGYNVFGTVNDSQVRASEVVSWVLSHALPTGGFLAADPFPDPALTPFWSVTNLAPNPTFFTLNGAAAGFGATALTPNVSYLSEPMALRWAAAAGGSLCYVAGWDTDAAAMTALPISAEWPPGIDGPSGQSERWLWVSVDAAEFTGTRSRQLVVQFRPQSGSGVNVEFRSDLAFEPFGWGMVGKLINVPPGEWYLAVGVEIGPTSATTLNAWATNVMIAETRFPVRAFSGSTSNIGDYSHAWDGDSYNSPSTRFPKPIERRPEAFVWRAGQGALSFLAPLLQAVGLRLVHNGLNEWTLRHTSYVEPGTCSIVYGQDMIGYQLASDLDTAYEAAAVVYTWHDSLGDRRRTDYFELNSNPRRTRRLEIAAAYPGPGRAENIVRRAQTGGRVAQATTDTQWGTSPEQALTIETSIDGHPETTFTDWTEQRRNYIRVTDFTSEWSVNGSSVLVGGAIEITSAGTYGNMLTGSSTLGADLAGTAASASYLVENIGALPFSVEPRFWDGASYSAGPRVTIPPGESRLVKIENIVKTGAYVQPRLWQISPTQSGAKIRVSEPLLEKATSVGGFFDGNTDPAGMLERTRWLSTPDASASVIETREVVETVWVNDPEVILTGTVGAVTFNLDDDTMTVTARRQEEA